MVTIAEHIGDHTALSAIIDKDLLRDPGLDRTLLGDGIATFVAGAIGGPANTTYGVMKKMENQKKKKRKKKGKR